MVTVHFNADGSTVEEPFLSGFVVDEEAIGRPVAVAVGVDGELFVTDDYTGAIYRIVYGERAPRTASLPSTISSAGHPRGRHLGSGRGTVGRQWLCGVSSAW